MVDVFIFKPVAHLTLVRMCVNSKVMRQRRSFHETNSSSTGPTTCSSVSPVLVHLQGVKHSWYTFYYVHHSVPLYTLRRSSPDGQRVCGSLSGGAPTWQVGLGVGLSPSTVLHNFNYLNGLGSRRWHNVLALCRDTLSSIPHLATHWGIKGREDRQPADSKISSFSSLGFGAFLPTLFV